MKMDSKNVLSYTTVLSRNGFKQEVEHYVLPYKESTITFEIYRGCKEGDKCYAVNYDGKTEYLGALVQKSFPKNMEEHNANTILKSLENLKETFLKLEIDIELQ